MAILRRFQCTRVAGLHDSLCVSYPFFIIWLYSISLIDRPLSCKILGESLLIPLGNGCCSIKCQSFKRICFKFGTAGWYCVTKGKIRFVCSEKSQSLAFNEAFFDPWWLARREVPILKCFSMGYRKHGFRLNKDHIYFKLS